MTRPPDARGLPLEGVRVLDLTIVWAGPFATQILADLGAEVIRVESLQRPDVNTRGNHDAPQALLDVTPWGANYPDRQKGDRPWDRSSAYNLHSRNKLSVTLDWERERGMELFLRLFERSDVLVDNNAAATARRARPARPPTPPRRRRGRRGRWWWDRSRCSRAARCARPAPRRWRHTPCGTCTARSCRRPASTPRRSAGCADAAARR